MDCDACGALISAALDGELDDARAREVERHVRSCPACARRRERLTQARSAVGSLQPTEPSPGFDRRVAEQVRAARWRRRWLFPVAATVALAVVGLFSLDRRAEAPFPDASRALVGHDVVLPLGMDAGKDRLQTAADCGAPGAETCRAVDSPCASAASCGPPLEQS